MARTKRTAHESEASKRRRNAANNSTAATPAGITKSKNTPAGSIKFPPDQAWNFVVREEVLKRLIKETLQGIDPELHIHNSAVDACQLMAEVTLREMWEDLTMCAAHNGRDYLNPDDFKLAKCLSTAAWKRYASKETGL